MTNSRIVSGYVSDVSKSAYAYMCHGLFCVQWFVQVRGGCLFSWYWALLDLMSFLFLFCTCPDDSLMRINLEYYAVSSLIIILSYYIIGICRFAREWRKHHRHYEYGLTILLCCYHLLTYSWFFFSNAVSMGIFLQECTL
jgi:hypothetical protein